MKLKRILYFLKNVLYYQFKFGKIGIRSIIKKPLQIDGANNMLIGDDVIIANQAWLAAMPLTNSNDCKLIIEDGCRIGNFNHIYATKYIKLGKNVLTADKVYISDNQHHYEDIHTPVLHQDIKQIGLVEIGDGSWIGENVCILGCKIGKNCVLGANSVITKDIPDYSVAVGIPAKIIKRYNLMTDKWEKV